jgi:hypothetical protein
MWGLYWQVGLGGGGERMPAETIMLAAPAIAPLCTLGWGEGEWHALALLTRNGTRLDVYVWQGQALAVRARAEACPT